ncbi:Polyphenol oxidase family protein [Candidatus Bealeia paramacronuclearis]|uniref:Purine nucleoside phosphorylase n=1 Tax=Candidatus Bealeia paramacronuclearis TaxID=1921001 RepID=A0ABZ2C3M4_9PROT|nr:Polyphenol oxidase family protein [Candidatus Bealeia paramacronuclearis]
MIHTSPELLKFPDIQHGFFEQSATEMPSLNCAFVNSESAEQVHAQRQFMIKIMRGEETPLLTLKQIHSATVHIVESTSQILPEGDALVTRRKNIALGVLTADCGPVIFADPTNEVIGIAHAGWRGAMAGILGKTIKAMESLGAERDSLYAILGPTIQQSHYEVGSEFEELLGSDAHLFLKKSQKDGHFYFDLPHYIVMELEKLGVASPYNLALNTFTGNFFSRRKALQKSQHPLFKGLCNLSAIAMS